jgi:hypothetical protein
VLETIFTKTRRQLVGVKVIQSLNAIITSARVDMVVAPNRNVATRGIIIGSIVTRQLVTEQAFCGCVICVNARIADQGFRADPATSFIDESGGF